MTSHEAAAHEASALPIMLPGRLIGREDLLKQVFPRLKEAGETVWLHGPEGVGKTAIAATLASAFAREGGGTLWLNATEDPMAALLVRVGRAYDNPEISNSEDPLGTVGMVTSIITQQKPFIVIDGRPNADAVREFVEKIALGVPVLVTSRTDADGPWTSVATGPLSNEAAAELFAEKAAQEATPDVSALLNSLDNQPFAVNIVAGAARVSQLPPARFAEMLTKTPADVDPQLRALTVGFQSLQQPFQGLILMLGSTFTGSASLELLSSIAGAQADAIQKVMAILSAAGFIQLTQRYGEPYYTLHSITHAFAQTFLNNSGRIANMRDNVRDKTLAYAEKYKQGTDVAHDKLATEMENFLALARWAAEQGQRNVATQIIVALTQAGNFISGRGYRYELLQLSQLGTTPITAFSGTQETPIITADAPAPEADGLDDAEVDEDDIEEVPAVPPADAPVDMTDPESLRAGVNAARLADDQPRMRELQTVLAKLLADRGSSTEAISVYSDLLQEQETANDNAGVLATLQPLAKLMVKTDNSQAAILNATRGARLAEEEGDEAAHRVFLTVLGDARQQLGESTEAILAYSHALEIARSIGDRAAEADVLMQLGFAQLDDGETETAITTWDTALAMCKELGKRDCEGRVLGGLGSAYGELNRWAEAVNFHTSAVHIAREVRDRDEEALQLSNLGFAAVQANDLGTGLSSYRQALHIAFTANDRTNIVSNIVDIVRLLVESPMHLKIAELRINEAAQHDATDREVTRLQERVRNESMMAEANGVQFREVRGTAQDYAASAYNQ